MLTIGGEDHVCLVQLKGLSNLKTLDLSNTKITDAALEHLKHLPELSRLYLGRTADISGNLVDGPDGDL